MNNENFTEKISDIIDCEEFDMDSDLENFPLWDSLAHLTFISLALSDGKTVSPAEIRNAKKIADLFELVKD